MTRRARANFAVIEVVIETIDWYQILYAHSARAALRASTGWRTEYVTASA